MERTCDAEEREQNKVRTCAPRRKTTCLGKAKEAALATGHAASNATDSARGARHKATEDSRPQNELVSAE